MENMQSYQTKEMVDEQTQTVAEEAFALKESVESEQARKKRQINRFLVAVILAALGGIIQAISVYEFIKPNMLVTGGTLGIAIMVETLTGFSQGAFFLVANLPLVLLSFFKLGKKFTILTLVYIVVQGGVSMLLPAVGMPIWTELQAQEDFVIVIIAGVVYGVGLAFALMSGGSTGGVDILGVMYQRKHGAVDISWVLFAINTAIILSSGLFYIPVNGSESIMTAILSTIMTFVISMVSDTMLNGMSSAIRFEIVTTKGEEVKAAILQRLHRGATEMTAKGAYTGAEKTVLICVIHKRQISEFKKLLRDVDPKAFAFISTTNEVMGKGFVGK